MSSEKSDRPRTPQLSQRPLTGWILLAAVIIPGAWILPQFLTRELPETSDFGPMIRGNPTFQFTFLDFFVTASWAFLVMLERADLRSWRFWLPAIVFMPVPSVGVALFAILNRREGTRDFV